mgnify:CR=1 FL=1
MSDIERLRHSAAHVLATAILRIWPEAQFAAGPPVENGFYYDLECSHRISPEDFEKIEAEMKKEIKANNVFEKVVVERAQAIKDAACAAIQDGYNQYAITWGAPPLREAIAAKVIKDKPATWWLDRFEDVVKQLKEKEDV